MRFVSKYAELKLVMQPSESFVERGRTVVKDGKHIRFRNGTYETTDQKEIKWLKNHPNFGTDFFVVKSDPVDKLATARKQISADDQKIEQKGE